MLHLGHCQTSRHALQAACVATSRPHGRKTRWLYVATTHDQKNDIAILGGGITGLATAYYLSKKLPRAKISIYEAKAHMGGWISSRSVNVDGGKILFEAGPRTLRPNGNGALAARLVSDLGLADDTIFTTKTSPAALNRYLYYPDRLVCLPSAGSSFAELAKVLGTSAPFKGLMPSLLKSLIFRRKEPEYVNKRSPDESVGEFMSRHLGSEVVDRAISAGLHGIYAGDVWKLSAKSLMPSLWKSYAETKSLWYLLPMVLSGVSYTTKREAEFLQAMQRQPLPPELSKQFETCSVFTFRRGLAQMTVRLIEHLRRDSKLVEFHTSAPICSVSMPQASRGVRVDLENSSHNHTHVISTLSPGHLGQIVQRQPSLATVLGHIESVSVMTVNLYYRSANLHPAGFGYLIPRATSLEQNPEYALGVIFDNSYSPEAGKDDPNEPYQDTVASRGTKLTVMLGGHYWAGWPAHPSDSEAETMAKSLLERHLGITETPLVVTVNLQQDCIPQYTVGHNERITQIHQHVQREYKGKLRIAGSWIDGVGVNDCLRKAWNIAEEFHEPNRTGLEAIAQEPEWILQVPDRQSREKS